MFTPIPPGSSGRLLWCASFVRLFPFRPLVAPRLPPGSYFHPVSAVPSWVHRITLLCWKFPFGRTYVWTEMTYCRLPRDPLREGLGVETEDFSNELLNFEIWASWSTLSTVLWAKKDEQLMSDPRPETRSSNGVSVN